MNSPDVFRLQAMSFYARDNFKLLRTLFGVLVCYGGFNYLISEQDDRKHSALLGNSITRNKVLSYDGIYCNSIYCGN